jgi:ubiquitin
MELRLGRGMTILVKTMAHTTMMLEVELSDTVFDVKKKIQDTDGIPIREQRLIYTGRQLIDDRTLADYDIQKGSQMHLVVWCYLLGGYIHPPNYLSYVDYLRMCAWRPVMGPS